MTTPPPSHFEALRGITDISDPAQRAKEAGEILGAVPELQTWLRHIRQEAVLEMRNNGMSHADVASTLKISRARAQQIAEGRTTGKRADKDGAANTSDQDGE